MKIKIAKKNYSINSLKIILEIKKVLTNWNLQGLVKTSPKLFYHN